MCNHSQICCINKYKKYAIVFASTQLRIARLRKYPIDPKAYLGSCTCSKTCTKRPLTKRQTMVLKTNYRLMQFKSIAESAILSTFIMLPVVVKIIVLFIFEWPFNTGLTVDKKLKTSLKPMVRYGDNLTEMVIG